MNGPALYATLGTGSQREMHRLAHIMDESQPENQSPIGLVGEATVSAIVIPLTGLYATARVNPIPS